MVDAVTRTALEDDIIILLDAVSSTVTSAVIMLDVRPRQDAVVQATITGTATVQLEGSLNNTDWIKVGEFSTSEGKVFTRLRYLRGRVSAYTSGTVSLYIQAKQNV